MKNVDAGGWLLRAVSIPFLLSCLLSSLVACAGETKRETYLRCEQIECRPEVNLFCDGFGEKFLVIDYQDKKFTADESTFAYMAEEPGVIRVYADGDPRSGPLRYQLNRFDLLLDWFSEGRHHRYQCQISDRVL